MEAALRAVYGSGIDLPFGHQKIKRTIRRYLAARPASEFDLGRFLRWVYQDRTGDTAAWHLDRQAGGRHG